MTKSNTASLSQRKPIVFRLGLETRSQKISERVTAVQLLSDLSHSCLSARTVLSPLSLTAEGLGINFQQDGGGRAVFSCARQTVFYSVKHAELAKKTLALLATATQGASGLEQDSQSQMGSKRDTEWMGASRNAAGSERRVNRETSTMSL